MLPRLIRHMLWADRRTAEALASLPTPDPELSRLHHHLLAAEAAWLSRIGAYPPEIGVWPELAHPTVAAVTERNHREFTALADALGDGVTGPRQIAYINTQGDHFTNTVEEILHHVCLHGMYHRGQIARGVRLGGGTPLATDFIAFMREGF